MRRAANAGLALLVVAIAVTVLAVAAVPTLLGVRSVSINRNSMQSELPAGSLAWIRPATTYTVGDIITYGRPDGQTVTHQIVALAPNRATGDLDGTLFQTKGSANLVDDPYQVPVDAINGRVVASVPLLGAVATSLGALPVQIFLITLGFALYLLGRDDRRHPLPSPAPEPTPA